MNAENGSFAETVSKYLFPNKPAIAIVPFQPNSRTVEAISAAHTYEVGRQGVSLYGNHQKTLIVNDVPFSSYWQLKEKKFIFHPMVWGRYVHSNAKNYKFIKKLPELSERMGATLPNGGLAFYYPNLYPLSRMSGPEFMYSAISQSEALSGYLNAEIAFPEANLASLTDRVRDALFFSHEGGGVDLGVAQLEMPLMHANPEIILNGWLHSLFNLIDYATARKDLKVFSYVEKNLEFFLKHQDAWYDKKRSITKYSETSPLRVLLRPSVSGAQQFCTLYESTSNSLPNYAIDPKIDFRNVYGGYDNRIISKNLTNGTLTFVTTCSELYRTVIASDNPFEVKVKEGAYDPERASPLPTGNWKTISSTPSGSFHLVDLKSNDFEIFRGYPTNFAKANGKNFYHIQHIVALAYIASTAALTNDAISAKLLQTASMWYEQTHSFVARPFDSFESLQTVLDAVNRGKLLTQITEANKLNIG